jgi:hypothetical protein
MILCYNIINKAYLIQFTTKKTTTPNATIAHLKIEDTFVNLIYFLICYFNLFLYFLIYTNQPARRNPDFA